MVSRRLAPFPRIGSRVASSSSTRRVGPTVDIGKGEEGLPGGGVLRRAFTELRRGAPLVLGESRVAGRPDLVFGRTSLEWCEGMVGQLENDFIDVKSTSFAIDANIEIGDDAADGVIVAQGGRF